MSSTPNGGAPQRLTTSPGVDTDASFSPDGSKIVFESDRSGTQQLYVMNADGSGQRRISFGGGGTPRPSGAPTATGSPSPGAIRAAGGSASSSPTAAASGC